MFVTDLAFKSPLPAFMEPPTEKWRAVELMMYTPWFLMTTRTTEGIGKKDLFYIRRTILVAEIADVEHQVQQISNAQSIVESVLVITPSWINDTATWQMEPLAAVWVAKKPLQTEEPSEIQESVEVYETPTGKMYAMCYRETPVEKLENLTLRCRFPTVELKPEPEPEPKSTIKVA